MTRPEGSSLPREAPRATDGYEPAWFSADVGGVAVGHWVYRGGRAGPAVIVVHEANGLTRRTVGVARRIQAGGMTPILPLLAGEVMAGAVGRLRAFAQVCVKREFGALANGEATPTAAWLRSLAQHESTESGGLGVGVIGMCLSGGYALAMAIDPSVKAVVSSQPAFPVALGSRRRQFGVNPGDLAALQANTDDGRCVRTLRYQRDFISPRARHEAIHGALPNETRVEIRTWNPFDHPVLSDAVEAAPDTPLGRALTDSVAFLRAHLGIAAEGAGRDSPS
jgi:dienelactone hydrolase